MYLSALPAASPKLCGAWPGPPGSERRDGLKRPQVLAMSSLEESLEAAYTGRGPRLVLHYVDRA